MFCERLNGKSRFEFNSMLDKMTMEVILILLIGIVLMGCDKSSDSSKDWQEFARKWENATIQEKKQMVDVLKI